MAHAQKPDFVFRRNGRVHLNRRGRQFCRLLAAEVCASAVVMLDTPCSEVVWRVLATHSIRQFPLHFPPHVTMCHHISTGVYPFSLTSVHDKTIQSGQPSVWTAENPEDLRVRVQVSPRKSLRKVHLCLYGIRAATCIAARLFGEVCAVFHDGHLTSKNRLYSLSSVPWRFKSSGMWRRND